MTLLVKRNGSLFPSITSDLFDTDRFFSPRLSDFEGSLLDWEPAMRVPAVNISETDNEFKLELAVPGLTRKDIKVETDNGMLTISAEKEEESKEEKKNYRRREYAFNSFSRSFTLPENVIADKIDAKYNEGVLRVSLPKKEVTITKPKKQIKID